MLVVVDMAARVPAVGGHVDAAAESEPVVDHHDLVVVAGTDRVRAIELEVDLVARRPAREPQHRRPASQQLDRAEVPLEDVDLQPRPVLGQPGQEGAQFRRSAVIGLVIEANPRVEVPADQQDLLLGAKHRLPGEVEIVGRIDDERGAFGALHPPAIPARLQQCCPVIH